VEALVTAESLSETTPEFDEKTKPRPSLAGVLPFRGGTRRTLRVGFHRRSRASRLDRTATCVGLTSRKALRRWSL
jgi:hypothetical protein